MRRIILLVIAMAVSASLPGRTQTPQVLFDVVHLGMQNVGGLACCPEGEPVSAWALNEADHVVGYGNPPNIWRNGSVTPLGIAHPPDCREAEAHAINNRDEAVGWTCGESRPFFSTDGVMIDLLGANRNDGGYGWATDINDRGQVVGFRWDPSVVSNGRSYSTYFIWENGVLTDLGITGSDWHIRINNRGQVVGNRWNPDPPQTKAFLWERGRVTDLAANGCEGCIVTALNDRGQIAGHGPAGAFLWESGVRKDLGNFSPWAMNNRGQIVGQSDSGPACAVLWEDGVLHHVYANFPTGVACPSSAVDINERGNIVTGANYLLVRR